jgi:MFS family permease
MIRNVGHVRVFAALASMISAALILYAAWPNEYFWFFLRVAIGFCFSGVYVVAESWLNDSATNETRGQTLSLYLIVQMMGIILSQGVLNIADPNGYVLFVLVSVAVSLSFAPILLSVSPAPVFSVTKPMTLRELYRVSPLGMVGSFVVGALFSAQFGMAAIYGTETGMTIRDISIFVASFYVGGLVLQLPIGWLSDRMDRRLLILVVTILGAVAATMALAASDIFWAVLVAGFFVGGFSNPLYSLLIAYTNDFLEHEDMAAASGGLIFATGIGAIIGPPLMGWSMGALGPDSFFGFIVIMMVFIALYAAYRMTVRAAPSVDETSAYAAVTPSASAVVVEVAQEHAIEMALEAAEEDEEDEENAYYLDGDERR